MIKVTQYKSTFEDSGYRKCDEKPKEDEHYVVNGESTYDGAANLGGNCYQHGRTSTKLVRCPSKYDTTNKHTTHIATLHG